MSSCCACCCFYPKYKRKVDNIYPRSLDAPLNKPEVDKLQYYVKIHPEKLSKIGDYLYQNLKWGLNGTYKNKNYVKNTIEAVDKILMAITPQNLNYYANSYLRIIQKLLEQGGASGSSSNNGIATSASVNLNLNYTNNDNLEYQKMAASMFQKFCEKEASNSSTTSFNSNYDSFVCQFSSMCYNNNKDDRIKAEIRSSGLQCLATMVKRLVPDDSLRAGYLWDNMDKIVPALLFIMHENFTKTRGSNYNEEFEDRDLERYIYKSKYTNGDDEISLSSRNINDVDIDRVKIKFRKSNNDGMIGGGANSTTNIEKVNKNGGDGANNSGNSSPGEGNVMIVLNENNINRLEIVDPDHESKMLLKNLAYKADFTTINKIVLPILTYLDNDKAAGWQDSRFVRCIFLILMNNVKQQHAIVIKELIKHLDSHRNSSAQLKCYIIRAISICIRISAMHSVGTAGQITEITTNLLKHLNISVEKATMCEQQLIGKKVGSQTSSESSNDELNEQNKLQREIINAISEFTSHLPDYSKNEVIMFITRFINSQQFSYLDLAIPRSNSSDNSSSILNNQLSARDQLNAKLRPKYFECLHEICTKYKPTQLFSAFTSGQFYEDILRLTLVLDWSSRLKAHDILHQLLDKYQILNRIKQLKPNLFYDSIRIAIVNNEINKTTSSNSFYKSPREKNTSNLSLSKVSNATSLIPKKSDSSHTNLKSTRNQTYLSQLGLNENLFVTSKEDIQFMRKYGRTFLAYLNENLFFTYTRQSRGINLFLTTSLFLIGLYNEKEFLVDLVRFGFHVQELALLNHEQSSFNFVLQCNVHKYVCAYFLLLSKTYGISDLYKYCSEICDIRRKKDLFRYVYPEYILLDTMLPGDSGINSTSASLTEIENEFKRELAASAKEYSNTIYSHNQPKQSNSNKDEETNLSEDGNNIKIISSNSNLDEKIDNESYRTSSTVTNKLSASKKSLISTSSSKIKDDESKSKTALWLFNKKKVGEILENAGYSTTLLFMANSDYSLSVSYLQQTLNPIQTVLRFRSPYSYSYDSIAPIILGEDGYGNNSEQTGLHHHHRTISKSHTRGYSGAGPIGLSPSTNQLISTPRRSVDVESYSDDNTSYDSTSQISLDPNGYEPDYSNSNNKLFYIDGGLTNGGIDANQATINSLNLLKQQQYLYQQHSKDITSFETIKKILINGNMISSNMSNSGVGGGGSSTIGANSGIVLTNHTSSTSSMAHKNSLKQNGTAANENDRDSNQSDQHLENSMKIISEFKQKPFDELKESLLKSAQPYKEKYQQVFELISKEINKEGTNVTGGLANSGGSTIASNLSQINNIGNMNSSLGSLSGSSNQSGTTAGGVFYKETYQQRMIPLNDIEFPQLFMY